MDEINCHAEKGALDARPTPRNTGGTATMMTPQWTNPYVRLNHGITLSVIFAETGLPHSNRCSLRLGA